jgi:hypothetical protein
MRRLAWAALALVLVAGCDRRHWLGSFGDAGVDSPEAGPSLDADGEETAPDGSANALVPAGSIEARHIALDAKAGRLYATVGGAASAHANSLVVIEVGVPAGRVASAVPIGSEPTFLALSDDGTTAWVGVDGDFSVRKVDLTTSPPTPGKAFTLPKGNIIDHMTTAGPMAVLQGSATTLAVSLRYWPEIGPGLAGVVILDDGVPREMMAPEHSGAQWMVRGAPGWLFGSEDSTAYGLYSLPVTASGVTQMMFDGLLSIDGPVLSQQIVYAANRVYATTGVVVDVTDPTTPMRLGTFPFTGAIAPAPSKQRAYMLTPPTIYSPERPQALLRLLDTEAFSQLSETAVAGLPTDQPTSDLVLTRPDQLAFVVGGRLTFLTVEPL